MDAQVLIALAGGVGTVGLIAMANRVSHHKLKGEVRHQVDNLEKRIGGTDRTSDKGVEGEVDTIFDKLEDIEHQTQANRRMVRQSFTRLCDTLEDHPDVDVDPDEVIPDD